MNVIKLASVSALLSIAALGCRNTVEVKNEDKCSINPKTGQCYEETSLAVSLDNKLTEAKDTPDTVIKGTVKCENETKERGFELNSKISSIKVFKAAFCDIVLTEITHANLTYFSPQNLKAILTPKGDILAKETLFNTELDDRINVKISKDVAKNAIITIETATIRRVLESKDDVHLITSDKELSDTLGFTIQTKGKETAKVTFTRLVDTQLDFTNKKINRDVTSHHITVDYTDHFKRGATLFGLGTKDSESVETTRSIGDSSPITAETTHIHFFSDEGEVVESISLYADNVKSFNEVEAGFPAIVKEESMTVENLTAIKNKLSDNASDVKLKEDIDLLLEVLK